MATRRDERATASHDSGLLFAADDRATCRAGAIPGRSKLKGVAGNRGGHCGQSVQLIVVENGL